MSASNLAAAAQMAGGYAVDTWINVTLQPMTKVWQGVGGHSNFFLSEQDAREATGAFSDSSSYRFAQTLWRLAQVEPSPTHGFRSAIQEFVVDLPVAAAAGICIANSGLGSGSVFQYYIPDWEARLFRTGREFTFAQINY